MGKYDFVKSLIRAVISAGLIVISVPAFAENKNPEPEGPKAERPKPRLERYDIYVNKWLKMPDLPGRTVDQNQGSFIHKPVYGRGTVVIFLASSCEPCQEQIENIRRLEKKYRPLFTDFVYVFVNDANGDAMDFAKEFDLTGSKLAHGSHALLEAYKNPPLPSIFIGDRHGWLGHRFIEVSSKEIADVDQYLKLMTAF